jgi:hypothetical protein
MQMFTPHRASPLLPERRKICRVYVRVSSGGETRTTGQGVWQDGRGSVRLGSCYGLHTTKYSLSLGSETEADSESSTFTSRIVTFIKDHPAWSVNTEEQLVTFFNDPTRRVLNFPPMNRRRRQFIHEYCGLCEGLESESLDAEPNRSVRVWKVAPVRL